MVEKFDPAPHDRYAEDPVKAAAEDRETHDKLLSGLVGSFPASDPPSVSQPNSSRHDAAQAGHSLWERITGIFSIIRNVLELQKTAEALEPAVGGSCARKPAVRARHLFAGIGTTLCPVLFCLNDQCRCQTAHILWKTGKSTAVTKQRNASRPI